MSMLLSLLSIFQCILLVDHSYFCIFLIFHAYCCIFCVSCRNYNPVERRNKIGKDRNSRGSQKISKSLQANNMHNSASGDHADLNKMSGQCSTQYLPCLCSVFLFICIFILFYSNPGFYCLMHITIGPKQGRGSSVGGGANSPVEIQALSKEVLALCPFFLLEF